MEVATDFIFFGIFQRKIHGLRRQNCYSARQCVGAGRVDLARQYETLLLHFPNLELVDVTRDVARRAAQIRARYNVKSADALHIATALLHDAAAYVTNDRGLMRVAEVLPVVMLDDFVV